MVRLSQVFASCLVDLRRSLASHSCGNIALDQLADYHAHIVVRVTSVNVIAVQLPLLLIAPSMPQGESIYL